MMQTNGLPELSLLERAIADGSVNAELMLPGAPTPSVEAAARALGVAESQILKSLLFIARDGRVVLAIARGSSRVDREALALVHGSGRLRLATPEVALERTGYPAGGIPPVCHAEQLAVVVDSAVMLLDCAFGGGGRVDAMLRIAPAEIVRVTNAMVADVTLPSVE